MWIIVKKILFHIDLFRKFSRWHVRETLDSYGPKILRLPAEHTSIHPPNHHTISKLLRWKSPIIHTYDFTSGVKHSGCEVTSIHFLHKHWKFGHFQCFFKSCLQSGQIIFIQTISSFKVVSQTLNSTYFDFLYSNKALFIHDAALFLLLDMVTIYALTNPTLFEYWEKD